MRTDDIQAVLFDLDGTFADTAQDLAYALNRTLEYFDKTPLPFASIRPVVSHGGIALIRLGFDLGPCDAGYDERRAYLLNTYAENIALNTRLFDGIDTVLELLTKHGKPWGIVTNKPAWLTDPLMEAIGYADKANCVISGDTCEKNKPHPMPLLHASKLVNRKPHQCLYVGDAERDIAAARAAGMPSVAALWGYIKDDDNPSDWQADMTLETPQQLHTLLSKQHGHG